MTAVQTTIDVLEKLVRASSENAFKYSKNNFTEILNAAVSIYLANLQVEVTSSYGNLLSSLTNNSNETRQ